MRYSIQQLRFDDVRKHNDDRSAAANNRCNDDALRLQRRKSKKNIIFYIYETATFGNEYIASIYRLIRVGTVYRVYVYIYTYIHYVYAFPLKVYRSPFYTAMPISAKMR